MRGRAQEWNREREVGTWEALVCSVREEREKKKSEKEVFILYRDNIILIDKWATVTV